MIFRTLCPLTYFKFDNPAFAKYEKDEKDFMIKFMEAQLFVCFIEDRPWPRSDLFDYLVESKIWSKPLSEAVSIIEKSSNLSNTEITLVNVPEDSNSSSTPQTSPRKVSFVLRDDLIEAYSKEFPLPTPRQKLVKPRGISQEYTVLYGEIPVVYALNPELDPVPEEWSAMVKSAMESFDKWDTSSHERRALKRIVASFGQSVYRNSFCSALLNLAETKSKNLSEATASILSDLLHVMIEEDPHDYALAFQCLEIADRFYYNNFNISVEL